MRKPFFLASAICLICILTLSSCVVADKLSFNAGAGGKNHVDLSVDDFFVGVVEDLSDWESKGGDDPIIDVAVNDFVDKLEKSGTTSGIRFLNTGRNTYMGDFAFADFGELLADLSNGEGDQSIVTRTETNGRTRIEISINMDNYEQLTRMVPFLADPNFEVYGPLFNHDLSEEEYLEMVAFILGEECPESIKGSSIRIQVATPKAIAEHNGTLRNPKTVEFSFPLIDFLLLHESIDFHLEY